MPATTTNNGADVFDLLLEIFALTIEAESELASGLFSDDPDAREQAESTIADAKRLCDEL